MACAFAWWVSAVGVGATTGVVTVTMPSYKLQVIQVTTGKRLRGWTYSGRLPPCGAERISGVFVCARAPRPPWRAWALAWPCHLAWTQNSRIFCGILMVWAVFIFWNIPWNLGGPGEEFCGIFSGI